MVVEEDIDALMLLQRAGSSWLCRSICSLKTHTSLALTHTSTGLNDAGESRTTETMEDGGEGDLSGLTCVALLLT